MVNAPFQGIPQSLKNAARIPTSSIPLQLGLRGALLEGRRSWLNKLAGAPHGRWSWFHKLAHLHRSPSDTFGSLLRPKEKHGNEATVWALLRRLGSAADPALVCLALRTVAAALWPKRLLNPLSSASLNPDLLNPILRAIRPAPQALPHLSLQEATTQAARQRLQRQTGGVRFKRVATLAARYWRTAVGCGATSWRRLR
jgi:hypothetical protein